MIKIADKNAVRKARHKRQRSYFKGTAERPRLNVYRSSKHIYAQVIDDDKGITITSASTLDAEVKGKITDKITKKAVAKLVGEAVGKRAKEQGVTKVVFDRGGYLYTGRVASIAEGAREAGLDF